MGRTKKTVHAIARETGNPPTELKPTEFLAQITKGEGNSLWTCSLSDKQTILAKLPSKFHNTIWLRMGSFVVIDTKEYESTEGKLFGDITNIVRDVHLWKKQSYWPREFTTALQNENKSEDSDDDEEEESMVGKMPPSYSDESEDST